MLMHAYQGAVDHLHLAVVSGCDGGQNAVPYPRSSPSYKAVVAGGRRTELLRQSNTRLSSTRGTPRGLFGSSGPITPPLEITQLVTPHHQAPELGSLNHISPSGESHL